MDHHLEEEKMGRHLEDEIMLKKIVYFSSVLFLFVCLSFQIKSEKKDLLIVIKPVFGTDSLRLDQTKYCTDLKDTVSFTMLKFYISNLVLECEDGTKITDSKKCHLIDVDKMETLQIPLQVVPNLKIKDITFNVGIDSLTSVSGDLEGDLDPTLGMYWAWNSGYINMKLEGKSSSCTSVKKNFQFHIGGYLPNQNALQKVSLPLIEDQKKITIQVDVSKWMNKVSLKENHSIMIPGKKAIEMAQLYKNMFLIDEEK
jgi:hypothetical protein